MCPIAAQDTQARVEVVVVGVTASQVAGAAALEAITAVQDASVVEPDQIAGPERSFTGRSIL